MKSHSILRRVVAALGLCLVLAASNFRLAAAPAVLLFEDDFNRGIPGWTAVQPVGIYIDGPMRWQYDVVSGAWVEQSNIYTDNSTYSPSATAVMLINDAVAPAEFTFSARLTAGDDDGFGLVFGYQDQINFYRVTFDRQATAARVTGYPGVGWRVDRKVDDVTTLLFGSGTAGGAILFTNTQYRPFDVTITVSAGNLFSLTVVDDPNGAAIVHPLVVNQPLPGSAAGKVGLTTWGMSATNVRGFRIGNLNLAPVPLVNNPPNPLPDWTYVVPPRQNGTAVLGGHGQGIWSLALGVNGPYGTLQEDSDANGGNDAAGRVDFVAPSLVLNGFNAGPNYVLRTRIIPGDDDGHGVLFNFVDTNNYFRVALRQQSAATGVRRGLSVQKAVGGVISEIYFEDPVVNFVPASNVPYELMVAVSGTQFEIVVVGNPDGAAQTFHYGPITDAALANTGSVGIFSWGMSRTQVDFLRVEQVNGVGLLVSSPFGPADPPAGLNDFASGTDVIASVPAMVEDLPGVRRLCTGFTGFGSVPASGAANTVVFALNTLSALRWQWQTEYHFTAAASAGGSVFATPAEEWLPAGTTNVSVEAVADLGYLFAGWTGDSLSTDASLTFDMDRPVSLTARFVPDSDLDGMADEFEQTYFGNLNQGAADDADSDGRTNLQEYEQGTDPTVVEALVSTDGLSSQFENAQRDVLLPGQFVVRDFGMGFRGAFDVSNDYRGANEFVPTASVSNNVSFEGPRLVVRSEVWNPAWDGNFTARVIMTVGDNDGNCVYWRYQNHSNWYRVTICGEDNAAAWRALLGVTVQKRMGDTWSQLWSDAGIFTDPDDGTDPNNIAGWKRVRVSITSFSDLHTITVEGYDAFADPPVWVPKVNFSFFDSDLLSGRLAVGHWGQGTDPAQPTAQIPIDDGVLIEDVSVEVDGTTVFHEDWSTAPLPDQFPAGWSNPYAGALGLEGDWRMSAHGTVFQVSNFAPVTSGTAADPKADADALVLLAPNPGVANYQLELGFHPFDDDGIGFVYDFVDPDNYARAMFVSEGSGTGRIPQGLNISRKSGGVWSDIIVQDLNFIYVPGAPFAVRFSNNNGEYRLSAWNLDDPGTAHAWSWTDQRAAANNRFGLTAWGEVDAHFLYARALSLPERAAAELRIARIRVQDGQVTLDIVNTTGKNYTVEVTTSLTPTEWSEAATGQSGNQWTGALPTGAKQAFYRLVVSP